ncbi:MAG: hypothetical protein IJA11_04480 [Oscillospiraceae bacterium]|nr:hypothetical protein [Oscillospiraceae bacterium]
MIQFNNWQIWADPRLTLQQNDHLSRELTVSGPLPEGWDWTMLVQVDGQMDIWPLQKNPDGCASILLTAQQLGPGGFYRMQLRGTKGDVTRHTNVITLFVPRSLCGDKQWPVLPTEFSELERRVKGYASHPPVANDHGYWQLWDGEKYTDSSVPVTGGIRSVSYNADTWRWEVLYMDGRIDSFPGPSPIEGDKFTIHRNSFESYPVGEDTFFRADPRYEYFDDHHGDVNSDSYATYGIAEVDGSKVLKLRCVNSTTHKFDTMEPVVGAYTVGLDFKLETTVAGSRPGIMVNPFNEYRFDHQSGTITATVRAGDYARITDTGTTGSQMVYWMTNKDGTRFIPKENLWYSMQVRVELGRMVLRLWERGDEDTALEVVCETAAIGQRAMEFAKYWAVYTYAPGSASQPVPTGEHTIWLDELKVWRDLTGSAGKDGEDGKAGTGLADWRYNADTWRWEQVYTDGSIKTFPGDSPIDSRFTFFRDDFEGYAVGEDNFLAQTDHWQGAASSAIHYDVVSDGVQRCLRFRVNDSSSRAVATLNYPISGRATVQFDYKPTPADNSGGLTDLLDIRVLGNTVRAGVNFYNQCYIHTPAGAGPIRDAAGNIYRMDESIWYRVKLTAEVGRVTMKVWKRDTETEPDGTNGGVTVLEHAIVTEELLQAERQLRFEFGPMNYTSAAGEHVAYLDNVMVWRDLWTEADRDEIVSRVLAALPANSKEVNQ